MDLNSAIKFAQLVNAAYAIDPSNVTNSAGKSISAGGTNYTVVTTVYANDLATEINPLRGTQIVSIGLVLQAAGASDVVIAIRGTEGIMEWVQDAKFGMVQCPFLTGAGNTEDGFTDMYSSMRIGSAGNSAGLVSALAGLAFPQPVNAATPVTICGHSLGGALVTLLALDVATNSIFKNPAVYSYASPRTGDGTFTAMYNHMVPATIRIANRMDLVPKLPLPPLYDHVLGLSEVNPVQLLPLPPKILVSPTIVCEHVLNTYLFLLSLGSGGPLLPLAAACVPQGVI
jgi:Lipase (class 3)